MRGLLFMCFIVFKNILRHTILVYYKSGKIEVEILGGLLSGWRLTSLLGSILNYLELIYTCDG